MTAILTALSTEPYPGPGVGITDTCGLCRKPFDLLYPPSQYPSVTVEGEMPELICDTCQDEMTAEHFHAVSDPASWSCFYAHPYATEAEAAEYAAAVNEAGDCGSVTVVPCRKAA